MPVRMRGPQTGNGFVACGTCHQGITKPLNGANMVGDYKGIGAAEPAGADPRARQHPPYPAAIVPARG